MGKNGLVDVKTTTRIDPNLIRASSSDNIARFLAEDVGTIEPDEKQKALAYNMWQKGNRTAVKVARLPAGSTHPFRLVAGFHRHWAGMMIREGFNYVDPDTGEEILVHEPNFALGIALCDGNADDLAQENTGENTFVRPQTAMDKAKIARYYIDVLGWTEKKVALGVLGCKTSSYIGQLLKLLRLPTDMQMALARGLITPSDRVLMKLVDMAPDLARPFFDEIMAGNMVTMDDLILSINAHNAAAGGGDGEDDGAGDSDDAPRARTRSAGAAGAVMQPTPNVVRTIFEGLIGPTHFKPISHFAVWMVTKFLKGYEASEQTLENKLYAVAKTSAKALLDHLIEEEVVTLPKDFDFNKTWKVVLQSNVDTKLKNPAEEREAANARAKEAKKKAAAAGK